MTFVRTLLAGLVAGFAASAQAQPAPAGPPEGSGPYKAQMVADPGLPTHTIYRPRDLAAAPGKLPVVAWGNGACVNAGDRFRNFLTEIASYGYFVVALGPVDTRPVEDWPRPRTGPNGERILPPPETKSSQLIDAIDWAERENLRAGGPYAGRLDMTRIAVMGQSCGGVQALEVSGDPRVTTTVIWNSGMPIGGTDMTGRRLGKEVLERLHAPIAYFVGDARDQARPNAMDDFERLTLPVFFGSEEGVPHGGTYREANGGEFGGVAVAWLNWRLKGDVRAAKMFVGPDCGLCVNPRWTVRRKNLG